MASMLAGIQTALEKDGQLPITLHFVACCGEELGATGAHRLVKQGFRADFCVVGEPTDLKIVYAHKGVVRVRLATKGVAAHSSDPSRGVNAIYKMTPVLETLERSLLPELKKKVHPLLGNPTLSIGTIHGGTQVNVVPPTCAIEIDRRFVPGETKEGVIDQILDAVEPVADVSCEELEYYPLLEQPTASPLVRRVAQACEKILGKADLAIAPWGSDAGVFSAAGLPSVLLGPGSILQAHTQDEFVDLNQVVSAARIYAEIIRSFGSA
jgi:acetylornithine deacetylase